MGIVLSLLRIINNCASQWLLTLERSHRSSGALELWPSAPTTEDEGYSVRLAAAAMSEMLRADSNSDSENQMMLIPRFHPTIARP